MFRPRIARCGNKNASLAHVGPDQSSLSLVSAYPDARSIEDSAGLSAGGTAEACVDAAATAGCAGLTVGDRTSCNATNKPMTEIKAAVRSKRLAVMVRSLV